MHRKNELRGVAQLVSAPRSGRGGRKFESSHPDSMWSNLLAVSKLDHFFKNSRDKNGTNEIGRYWPFVQHRWCFARNVIKKMLTPRNPKKNFVLPYKHGNTDYVKQFTLPVLREGTEWYIEFYCFDPAQGKLRRKKIKINRIKSIGKRRSYAREVMGRITTQLQRGWNPWIAQDIGDLHLFSDVCDSYERYIDKMYSSGNYRKETYVGYKSYLRNLLGYIDEHPIYYMYQLDRAYIVEFLDYIFIDRDNGGQTRNNYLSWLSNFCGWAVDKCYLTTRPTDGIPYIDKKHLRKKRQVIPTNIVKQISLYLKQNDPYFLLACQLLYNCFIRPVEMTRLRVGWINIKAGTITIPADAAKNRETQVVTVPKKVLAHAIELGTFHAASQDFLFSIDLRPGDHQVDPVIFRHHWGVVRKALNLRPEWQFYSLKDTGITEMLDRNIASIAVRDQARHSSLAITEVYTRHLQRANEQVLSWEGSL